MPVWEEKTPPTRISTMSTAPNFASMPGQPSPFPPAVQVSLHRNPPLAPSQELAYRQKCIALKRRLAEIETNNDDLRRRLEREKRFQDKMRLNRAILLNHLKEMMDGPPNKKTPQKDGERGGASVEDVRHEYLMDDSSAGSEDEDVPEPQERPLRSKRPHHSAQRELIVPPAVASAVSTPMNFNTTYQQSPLPSLAPANAFSPSAPPPEPAVLTSSFRVAPSTVVAVAPPASAPYTVRQHTPGTVTSLSSLQSPPLAQPFVATPTPASSFNESSNADRPPVRPQPPFDQFTAHMTPQFQANSYPPDQIPTRIRQEWNDMGTQDRQLWEERYHQQMKEYERAMDEWKRGQRKALNGSTGGFSAVNR